MAEMMKWIDNTRIGCLERCPREFLYRHVLGLVPPQVRRLPQAFGNAIHRAIEKAIEVSLRPQEALEAALDEWQVAFLQEVLPLADEEGPDYRLERDTGEALLRHLFSPDGAMTAFLGTVDEVLGTEMRLEVPVEVGPGIVWTFRGRADVVARLKMGSDCLMDIKTTGWHLTGWHEKMQADTQLHSYAWALKQLGYDIYSACYVVGKVNRRLLKDGRWSPNISVDSAMFPVACTEDYMEKMWWRMRRAALELEGRLAVNHWECRFGSCLRFNNVCGYQPLCDRFWREDSPELDYLKEFAVSLGFRIEPWDPFAEDDEDKLIEEV